MQIEKLESIMTNFSNDIIEDILIQLGIKNGIAEWNFEGRSSLSKKDKIKIIVAIKGLDLFNEKKFRLNFFLAFEDRSALKKMLELTNYSNTSLDNQTEEAKYLADIEFVDNNLYSYLIRTYFEINDYCFDSKQTEASCELIKASENKFYELFDYQYLIKQQVINDLANEQKRLYKILIHMPTGTGKTKTAMHIIAHYINFVTKGKGIIVWIAHTNELLQQAFDTFVNVWGHLSLYDIKVFKGWQKFPDKIEDGILFVSIQSLQAKMSKAVFNDISELASLIVFDEVHKAGARKTKQCIHQLMIRDNNYGKKFLGLTATPGRKTEFDVENMLFANEFENYVGIDICKILQISLSENEVNNYPNEKDDPIRFFQENHYLSYLKKIVLEYKDESLISKVRQELIKNSNDYSGDLLNEISNNRLRNMAIIERIQQLNNEKKPTIIFACSLQHAKLLSAYLKLLDIDNSLVYGDMGSYARRKAIDDFKSGKVNFIINYEILTTGFDSTKIECVFITRPTKSVILYSQMIGRGLRGPKMGGKSECLLIDVEENLLCFNENKAFKYFNSYWRKENE